MHYVDLHWVVMPTVHRHGFPLALAGLGGLPGVGSAFGLVFWSAAGRALIPSETCD